MVLAIRAPDRHPTMRSRGQLSLPPVGNGVEIRLPPPVGGGLGWGPCGRTSTHLWPELELTAPSDGRCWTRRPPPCPPPTGGGFFFNSTALPRLGEGRGGGRAVGAD